MPLLGLCSDLHRNRKKNRKFLGSSTSSRFIFYDIIPTKISFDLFLFFSFHIFADATPAEAVKRKIPAEADAADAVVADDVSPTPEKKSKLEEAAKENGSAAAVEAEVVA